MSVNKFSDTKRPSADHQAAVQKAATAALITAAKARAATISSLDVTAGKLSKAFSSKRAFTAAEVKRIVAAIDTMGATANTALGTALAHMNTALRSNLATDKLVAQTEDLAALKGKLAILRQVAVSTLAGAEDGDDLLQIDDSGYVVDDGEDVMDTLPTSPEPVDDPAQQPGVAMASDHRAEQWGDKQNLSPEGLEGVPVGHPVEETVHTQSEPEVKNLPPSTRGETSQTTNEEGLDGEPVGRPLPAGDSNGAGTKEYSQQDPSTTPPGTKLARRRVAELPDFLKDKTNDCTTGAQLEPPNGEDLDHDKIAKIARLKAQARKLLAEANDLAGDQSKEYSQEDPKTEPPKGIVGSVADGQTDDVIPGEPAAPAVDTMAIGDESDNQDPDGFDPALAAEVPEGVDPGGDPDGLDENNLDLELPASGFDEMLKGEILADADFDLGPEGTPAPADPKDLSASARTARRLTAARTGGASPASEADVLASVISADLF